MKLVVEPIWPLAVVILAGCGLLAFVVLTYRGRVRRLPAAARAAVIGLRVLTVLVLTFAALRPSLRFSETDQQPAILFVARDTSRSMNTADGPGGATRWETLLNTLSEYESELDALREEVDVRVFDFDRTLEAADFEAAEADGDQTALGAVLESLLREAQHQRTLGVLLLSDGAQRALPPDDADPRPVARRLAEAQVPVHTIGFGESSLSEATLDVALEDLLVDPVVFEKKAVPVSVRLRALGAAERKISVRLLAEDRTGKKLGEPGELKPVPATQNTRPMTEVVSDRNAHTHTVELSFIPQQAGEFKLAVEAAPLEGEVLTRNNRVETIITVRKGGLNVAYFDAVRAEVKFIGMVNGSEKIQLDLQTVRSGEFASLTKIDPQMFEPGRYDVFIIGDVPAETFGPQLLRLLADRVNEGAGLLMIGGQSSFAAGGYGATPLADLLPVRMDGPAATPAGGQVLEPLPLIPTTEGLGSYVMRLAAGDENAARWAALPPLNGGNRLRVKNELAQVWARSPQGDPLLLAAEVGRARVAAFAGDTTYRWALAGHAEEHQRFWRQMILWLARKEEDTNQPLWVRVDPRNFAPGAPVPIEFGARDEEGRPLEDVQFQVQVTSPRDEDSTVTPQRAAGGNFAEFSETQVPGDYWVRVSATRDGRALGFLALTRFIVDARDLELDNPAADLKLLDEIAAVTGGTSLPAEQLGSFLERLRELKLPDYTKYTSIPLWDNWWLVGAFVGLMTSEWLVRKKLGLV